MKEKIFNIFQEISNHHYCPIKLQNFGILVENYCLKTYP